MKKWIWLIIIIILIGGVIRGVVYRRKIVTQVKYITVPVSRGEIVRSVSATGTLNPITMVQVGSQVSGRIREIYVDFNSKVEKGQVIAQIDLATFESQVIQAEANLTKAQVSVDEAKRNLDRINILWQKQLVAQSEKDSAQTSYDLSIANRKQAEASLTQAKTNLEYTTIKSPINGIVISRNIDIGQTVAASFQSPTLFTIANDLAQMQINAAVDEADIGSVVVNQSVSFTVDSYPEEKFTGRVTQIRMSPNIVQNVVTYDVIINVHNPKLKLRPGMTANVIIKTAEKDNVLKLANASLRYKPSLPEPAIKDKSTESTGFAERHRFSNKNKSDNKEMDKPALTVWILKDTRPVPVKVRLGLSDGKETELVRGDITEGDEVIIEETSPKKQTSTQSNPFMIGGPPRRMR